MIKIRFIRLFVVEISTVLLTGMLFLMFSYIKHIFGSIIIIYDYG
jgi:hypothetical protein